MVRHLFSPHGRAAMAGLFKGPRILAFGFEGLLLDDGVIHSATTPARAHRALCTQLARLNLACPVAVLSAYSASTTIALLGFRPAHLIASYGGESDPMAAADGPVVMQRPLVSLRILAPGATDRGHALLQLARRHDCRQVLLVGNEEDEPVFAASPPGWVTVRVGHSRTSRANFFLQQTNEIANCLLLLARLAQSGIPVYSPLGATIGFEERLRLSGLEPGLSPAYRFGV